MFATTTHIGFLNISWVFAPNTVVVVCRQKKNALHDKLTEY